MDASSLTLDATNTANMEFLSNTASRDGGAIYMNSTNKALTAQTSGSGGGRMTFSSNTALNGGAVYSHGGITSPLLSGASSLLLEFDNNVAKGGDGGAINSRGAIQLGSVDDKISGFDCTSLKVINFP